MPADKVERWAVDRLVPYARNARTYSDTQIAQIAASVREWGWTVPVLVDEAGTLIAGHGRVLAARQLGLAEIPVTVATGWSEAQKRAYTIADNKLALNAGWDAELLRVELSDLRNMGTDLGLIGFNDAEIVDLFAIRGGGLTDPDDIPEPLPESVPCLEMFGTSADIGLSAAIALIPPLLHKPSTARSQGSWLPTRLTELIMIPHGATEPA